MRAMRLEQSLAVAVTLSLTLLIASVFGLGVAIRHGAVVLPPWEVRLYKIHILAYRTDFSECPPTTLCPLQSVAPPPAFYVVWSIYEPPTAHQPYRRYGRTARRLLVVPLQR